MNRRIAWIDYCKAFAICLVIIGHILMSTSSSNSHIDNMIMVMIYSFHMPLFFMLSGLVFRKNGFVEGLKKKFVRLMIPYLVFCFMEFCFKLIFYSLWDQKRVVEYIDSFTKERIIDSILMNSSSAFSGYWFLPVLFCSSILLTILLKIDNHVYEFLFMLVGILVAIRLSLYNVRLPLGLGEALLAVPFLYIGFKEKESGYSRLKKTWVFIITIFGYISTIAYWKYMDYGIADMHNSAIRNPLAFYILGLCGGYITMFGIKWISSITLPPIHTWHLLMDKFCEYIGANSLYIYGIHYMLLEIWVTLFLYFQFFLIQTSHL